MSVVLLFLKMHSMQSSYNLLETEIGVALSWFFSYFLSRVLKVPFSVCRLSWRLKTVAFASSVSFSNTLSFSSESVSVVSSFFFCHLLLNDSWTSLSWTLLYLSSLTLIPSLLLLPPASQTSGVNSSLLSLMQQEHLLLVLLVSVLFSSPLFSCSWFSLHLLLPNISIWTLHLPL